MERKRKKLVKKLVHGGLLNNHEADVCMRIIDKIEESDVSDRYYHPLTEPDNLYFNYEEIFAIYTCIKSNVNYAPDENKKFEVDAANSIFEKIENFLYPKEEEMPVKPESKESAPKPEPKVEDLGDYTVISVTCNEDDIFETLKELIPLLPFKTKAEKSKFEQLKMNTKLTDLNTSVETILDILGLNQQAPVFEPTMNLRMVKNELKLEDSEPDKLLQQMFVNKQTGDEQWRTIE